MTIVTAERTHKSVNVVERDGEIVLFSLANDGTLWRRNAKAGEDWVLIKNVPQGEPEEGAGSYKQKKSSKYNW